MARRIAERLLGASAVGVTVSVMVHLAAALLAAGIVVAASSGSGDAPGSLAAETTLTTLTETDLTDIKEADLAAGMPKEQLPEFAPPKIDLADASPGPVDLAKAASPAADLAGLGGAGVSNDNASGGSFGDGSGLGGAGGGGTRFFGVEATGSRFAYIVDISGSMAGPKLESLKHELESSIDTLAEHASFSVVLFSTDATPLGGKAGWTDAAQRHKKATFAQIATIQASGATNPAPAFEIVFSLRPRPDAIYFMTDGLFDAAVVGQIEQINRSSAGTLVPVHCIAFTSRESEHLLKRIAEFSDGTYTYVPASGVMPRARP